MPRVFCTLAALLCLGLLAGCNDARKTTAGTGAKESLDDLGQMLKTLAAEKRKPPGKLAELEPVEPLIPLAGPLIRGGELVYLWGAEYVPGGKKVVAYQKKAEAEGGWVLLQDGTVQEMTASEFAGAARAK